MPGFSLTLLLLPSESEALTSCATQILSLLDDQPDVPGWKWFSTAPPAAMDSQVFENVTFTEQQNEPRILKAGDPDAFVKSLRQAAKALITAEPEITQMDLISGDGDCGLTLKVRRLVGDQASV